MRRLVQTIVAEARKMHKGVNSVQTSRHLYALREQGFVRNTAQGWVVPEVKGASLASDVARRILQRFADGEKAVVVTGKNGSPKTVYGFDEYIRMKELPKKVKPWEHRQDRRSDEIPIVDAPILIPISRDNIYE
ncbi:MAG: hypothetical protein AB7K24_32355 [Gemmataceae bacterium]